MAGWLGGALIAAALALASPAGAQELRIALAAEPTSIDPLYHTLNPNNQIARHIFDRLVHQDPRQRLMPGSRSPGSRSTRRPGNSSCGPGVVFHDGAPLTPDDIIFSIDRADKVPNSPASFAIYTKAVKGDRGGRSPDAPHQDRHALSAAAERSLHHRDPGEARGRGQEHRGFQPRHAPPSAPVPSNSWSGCRATAWCWSATTSTGARSPTGRR